MLIVTLVADGLFSKASRPNAPFFLTSGAALKVFPLREFERQIGLKAGCVFTFPPYGCCLDV
jgi:hypothetical protein